VGPSANQQIPQTLFKMKFHCYVRNDLPPEAIPSHVNPLYTLRSTRVNSILIVSSHWSLSLVRFEVFTAVTMKNGVFWDVTPCGSCKSRRFGRSYRLHHHGGKNVVPNSPILVTLMMQETYSSESSVIKRATRHNIPEESTVLNHRSEYLKFYIALPGWAL
jgi:hypothetical protein